MRGIVSVAVVLSSVAPAAFTQPPATGSAEIAIVHAELLDVTTGDVASDATVICRGRQILSVARQAPAPAGAIVIDARGKYLLPGLIDAHAHVADLRGARTALESGVTTIRSAGVAMYADVALRELVKSGAIAGPDVLAAGVHILPALGDDILADRRLFDLVSGVRTLDQIRRVTQVNLEHGVDVIKTSATDRAGTSNTDPRQYLFDEPQLRAIVETAAARNIWVETHAHGDEGAANAVRAGVRSIEHGTFLSDATLALMKEKGTYFVPTYSTLTDIADSGGDYDEPALHVRGRHMVPRLRLTIQHAYKMGVKIATGADTEYSPRSFVRIGQEVANLMDAGVSPLTALQAATTTAAELLGVASKTGAIRPGLEADLIIVDLNPLEHVFVLEDPLLVMSNGQIAVNRLDPARSRGQQ